MSSISFDPKPQSTLAANRELVVKVEGLGKRFRFDQSGPYENMADFTKGMLKSLRQPLDRLRRKQEADEKNWLWALKDINLEVRRGELLGIVGHNGAGKSTFLKILSQVTTPTEGQISVWGNLACLLEVGTGFNPMLTGKENIFLNGVILGMTHAQVIQKYDQIVEFSDVGKFIEMPVRRYSSGMRARLAFSVATHLDPDLLVADEVLAVGDARFREKCFARMNASVAKGQTIFFVSHSENLIQEHCTRAVLLDHGRIIHDGAPGEVLEKYREISRN
ncbi:ABC transporter ATP-binding protein [Blastopirellula sp. J2-11]|uniref:ABC transporter ATP-binding protein n=1 Tax=Blastopirellula sp. J2-11 TaxID=2943192 RepID=UPI0021C97930|nr:ABC transporter ATP-binding protein [Blastopirellula sp. J2-11]UUO04584.1 ABC transporter ATP-binding protein [Blastopirellula sp. J2-11]